MLLFSAAFGGLLSLMLGFTLISGCDVILFFTIRIAYHPLSYLFNHKILRNKVNIQEDVKKDRKKSPMFKRKFDQTYENNLYEYGRY